MAMPKKALKRFSTHGISSSCSRALATKRAAQGSASSRSSKGSSGQSLYLTTLYYFCPVASNFSLCKISSMI